MADVQLEHGYTRVAHETLEAFARYRIPPDLQSVLFAIIRKTWGWEKKEDHIALSTLAKMTGLSTSHVSRAIKRLKELKMIQRDDRGLTRFQKDFDLWELSPRSELLPRVVLPPVARATATSGTKLLPPVGDSIDREKLSRDRRPTASPGDNPTGLLAEAKTYRSDDERWPDVIDKLKARGYYARIDGDVAGFFDGEWKVKGGQGWVKYAGSVRDNLTFVKRR